jgi:hypothetical protein
LGAQQLKAQSGSRRLRRMQKEVQRYARDLMRLKAEIIAEHFEPFMLELMAGKPVPPESIKLLRGDITRSYRIDIETDSTIAEDEQQDQAELAKLLDGITKFVAGIGPVVQAGYMPVNTAMSMLKSVVRRFKMGREVEDALEDAQAQLEVQAKEPPEPTPEEQQMQAELAMQQQKMQMEQQMQAAELEFKKQEAEMKLQMMQQQMLLEQQKFEREQARLDQEAVAGAERARYETDAKIQTMHASNSAQIEAMKAKAAAQPKPAKKAA